MWSRLKSWWTQARPRSEKAIAGAEGERLAAEFLRKQRGYRIVTRNWRSPRDRRDELDLVCADGDVLVFVEVKARAADALVSGYHAVNTKKKRVLLRTCKAYLRALGPSRRPATIRFDIVEVVRAVGEDGPVVHHFENVPLFPKELGH